ncbi:MAG: leucine-rich repeat domain-containing protein [Prevotellaceae bacterium]|nr:leucine-rich repeat domain-containing protein [Prevotellaceae bacterium]
MMDTGQKENVKRFLNLFVEEKVKSLANGVVLKAVDISTKWKEWEERWLQNYHGEEKIPHYILRALVHWMGEQYKPYNRTYRREFTAGDWEGEEPELSITIPAGVHNFLGAVEVNVYDFSESTGEGDGNERLVACEVSIDEEGAIIVTSATPFPGRLDIFCAAGEMPELQHRQPVFTVNNAKPDAYGNIMVSAGEGALSDFTYIVDSDEALAGWANNVAGHDYTKVLIKQGTWSSDKEINLTTAGTKVVVGELGSLLSFTSADGLVYNSLPSSNEYWMMGVNALVDNYGASFRYCINLTNCYGSGQMIFAYCSNLINCTGFIRAYNQNNTYSFFYCKKLTNCYSSNNNNTYYDFFHCDDLSNCTGSGKMCFDSCTNLSNCTGSSSFSNNHCFSSCTYLTNCACSSGPGYSFSNCKKLTNCTSSNNSSNGFYSCSELTNCTGGNNVSYGFYGCTDLVNCTISTNGGSSAGFSNCTNLTNCAGTGMNTGFQLCINLTNCMGSSASGHAFWQCSIMFGCYPNSSSAHIYTDCFMDKGGTIPVANTAAGGYNRDAE